MTWQLEVAVFVVIGRVVWARLRRVYLPGLYFVNGILETLVSNEKTRNLKRKYSPKAQTMRLASFGPVYVVSTFLATYFVNIN